jgi:hypothetical protein
VICGRFQWTDRPSLIELSRMQQKKPVLSSISKKFLEPLLRQRGIARPLAAHRVPKQT